jgi:hypothetical protein
MHVYMYILLTSSDVHVREQRQSINSILRH